MLSGVRRIGPAFGIPNLRHTPRLLRRARSVQAMGQDLATSPLVSAEWLHSRLNEVRVLDASWYMPAQRRDGAAEFRRARIPGAQYFDIDKVADTATSLPHMLPAEPQFAAAMDSLSISNDSQVVIYDGAGIFSAPRAWWAFKAFGHSRVGVLDGGLPAWRAQGLVLDEQEVSESEAHKAGKAAAKPPGAGSSYQATLQGDLVYSLQQVWDNTRSRQKQIVDARSSGRFQGTEPEPRPGLPSGHIPSSLNVPFPAVLQDMARYKTEDKLRAAFSQAGIDVSAPLVCTCGTGVTASILALALYTLDPQRVPPVYDGSWTEWASKPDTPRG